MNCNSIKKNIWLSSLFHIIVPAVLLGISIFILYFIPFFSIFFPEKIYMNNGKSLEEALKPVTDKDLTRYTITFPKLQYTGYDLMEGSREKGSYYYYISDTSCVFVLLDTDRLENKSPVLFNYTINGCTVMYDDMFSNMINSYANDINWTPEGIYDASMGYIISEPDYHMMFYVIIFIAEIIIIVSSAYIVITNLLYILFPYALHPCYRTFRIASSVPIGKVKDSLALVDEELSNNVEVSFGSAVITEHFLVDSDRHTSIILPFEDIIWVYSHQQLKKILWFNINLFSSMTFVTSKGINAYLHRKPADEARQIYSYLEAKYPHILLKYSKDNKLKAKELIKKQRRKIREQKKLSGNKMAATKK